MYYKTYSQTVSVANVEQGNATFERARTRSFCQIGQARLRKASITICSKVTTKKQLLTHSQSIGSRAGGTVSLIGKEGFRNTTKIDNIAATDNRNEHTNKQKKHKQTNLGFTQKTTRFWSFNDAASDWSDVVDAVVVAEFAIAWEVTRRIPTAKPKVKKLKVKSQK